MENGSKCDLATVLVDHNGFGAHLNHTIENTVNGRVQHDYTIVLILKKDENHNFHQHHMKVCLGEPYSDASLNRTTFALLAGVCEPSS